MHDQPIRGSAAARLDRCQRLLLDVLLTDRSPGLWSTVEVAQALGDPAAAADAIAELHAVGLVHVCGGFVFPTRAAVSFDRLTQPQELS